MYRIHTYIYAHTYIYKTSCRRELSVPLMKFWKVSNSNKIESWGSDHCRPTQACLAWALSLTHFR